MNRRYSICYRRKATAPWENSENWPVEAAGLSNILPVDVDSNWKNPNASPTLLWNDAHRYFWTRMLHRDVYWTKVNCQLTSIGLYRYRKAGPLIPFPAFLVRYFPDPMTPLSKCGNLLYITTSTTVRRVSRHSTYFVVDVPITAIAFVARFNLALYFTLCLKWSVLGWVCVGSCFAVPAGPSYPATTAGSTLSVFYETPSCSFAVLV